MSFKNKVTKAFITFLNDEVIEKLKSELTEQDISTSRRLQQSIEPNRVEFDGSNVVVELLANTYWKYINYGVDGIRDKHGAPNWGHPGGGIDEFKEEILSWMQSGGLYKGRQQNGAIQPINADAFMSYDELAEAIMFGIMQAGKEPRPFVDEAIEKVDYNSLQDELISIFTDEIRRRNGN